MDFLVTWSSITDIDTLLRQYRKGVKQKILIMRLFTIKVIFNNKFTITENSNYVNNGRKQIKNQNRIYTYVGFQTDKKKSEHICYFNPRSFIECIHKQIRYCHSLKIVNMPFYIFCVILTFINRCEKNIFPHQSKICSQ